MECFRCKFYKSGATSNSCSLFECECFRPFTKESPYKTVSEDYYSFTFTNNSFKIKNYHKSNNPLIVDCYQDDMLVKTFEIKLGGVI